MNISLVVLQNGSALVSQVEELEYEPRVHLLRPYLVSGKTKVTLTPWPEHTPDTHILLKSDSLLTMCAPTEEILDAYLVKIDKTREDFEVKEESQPVILTEEETPIDSDDDYEPRYYEE